jgi:hypothetical protein
MEGYEPDENNPRLLDCKLDARPIISSHKTIYACTISDSHSSGREEFYLLALLTVLP